MVLYPVPNLFTNMDIRVGEVLANNGIVNDCTILETGLILCHVTTPEEEGRVILWTDMFGTVVNYSTDLWEDPGAAAYACCLYVNFDMVIGENKLTKRALMLPQEIAMHPMFDIKFENEGWHGEDNDVCYEDVISDFLQDVSHSTVPMFSTLDLACESCLNNTQFDSSRAVGMIRDGLKAYRKRITVQEFMSIFDDRNRGRSGFWIIEGGYLDHSMVAAFETASERESLTQHQNDLCDRILQACNNINAVSRRLLEGKDFYAAERTIRREFGRGHIELASVMIDQLSGSHTVKGFELEAGRLRRDLGKDDSPGFFMKAFIDYPSGKRLIDVVDSNPGLDEKQIILTAWYSADQSSANALLFFARNGLHDNVSDVLLQNDEQSLDTIVRSDMDASMNLMEVLIDEGLAEAAALIGTHLLEYLKYSRDGQSIIAKCMWVMDSVCSNDQCPESVRDYCRSYGRYWKNKVLWDEYGNPEISFFR